MDELLTPQDVERLASERGLTIGQVCQQAGIAHSTFTRWRRGDTEPTLDVYRRIRAVVLTPPAAASQDAAA
jgi:transcriptional regulator with XRE-family HTH domain